MSENKTFINLDGVDVHCAYSDVLKTSELKPNPKNPNKHPKAQIELLSKIIKEQGWRNPIVVSRRSGFVTKGHARLMAAELLKVEQVPVDFQDYKTEAEEIADMIADNRLAELADLDPADVKNLIDELQKAGTDLDLTGYDEKQRQFFASLATGEGDFAPVDGEGVPRLDEKKKIQCPQCHHEFTP